MQRPELLGLLHLINRFTSFPSHGIALQSPKSERDQQATQNPSAAVRTFRGLQQLVLATQCRLPELRGRAAVGLSAAASRRLFVFFQNAVDGAHPRPQFWALAKSLEA
jgi:hypothetical protein